MSRTAALLRAVNVGGTGAVPMADLRALAQSLGWTQVRSLLQSGNLVFAAGRTSPDACGKRLEAACAKAFGFAIEIHIRTAAELAAIVAQNPFAREARDDPGRLAVLFLRAAPGAAAFQTLQGIVKGRETVRGDGRHAYIVYPDGMGTSKFTLKAIEKHLRTTGTMRNWNTVSKLAAMTAE